jgi:type IX secretion system substrate protein
MKKAILTIVIILFFNVSFSQTYHKLIRPNTYWDILHVETSQICGLSGGSRYFFQGDTVLNGIQYNLVQAYPIVNINPGPFCSPFAVNGSQFYFANAIMREDTIAQKVYVYEIGSFSESLLYDFTLVAGDTLKSAYASQGLTLIIDSVSTVSLFNSASRRIFYLSNNEYYIEGIGSSQGLFTPIVIAIGFWEEVECVIDNNVQLWGGTQPCYGFVGIDELINNAHINIYPNPVRDILYVKSRFIGELQFFDKTGRLVMSKNLNESTSVIDISGIASGLYFYRYETKSKGYSTGKIVFLD